MKITKRQLQRIIRESSWGRSEHDAEARGMVAAYDQGYRDAFRSPGRRKVGANREYKRGYEKGLEDAKRGVRPPDDDNPGRGRMREAEGSTKKYDDDSALRGKQSKLPDRLQKGIIDKAVEDREEHEEEEREEKTESLRRNIRKIMAEIALPTGDIPHRTMSGGVVPFGCPECVDDIENRITDMTHARDDCSIRSADRTHYNGILNVLRRDRRSAIKEMNRRLVEDEY